MSTRKQRITAAFSAAAATYDDAAQAQRFAAALVAGRLGPPAAAPRVLELGCGTGLLTRAVLARLPAESSLLATDLSPAMLDRARAGLADPRLRFALMDAEAPDLAPGGFDLIVSSLAAQWFTDLGAALARLVPLLAPGGRLVLATLGAGTFVEWRRAHEARGLASGVAAYPDAAALAALAPPGWRAEVSAAPFVTRHADASAFLRMLAALGAATPRPGHRPLPPAALRGVMADLGAPCPASWDILTLTLERAP